MQEPGGADPRVPADHHSAYGDCPRLERQDQRELRGGCPAVQHSRCREIRLDPPPDNVKGPSFPIATVMAGHRIALHSSPGGRVFEQAGDRTEFGSNRVYWIEKVQGSWFGVPDAGFAERKARLDQGQPVRT